MKKEEFIINHISQCVACRLLRGDLTPLHLLTTAARQSELHQYRESAEALWNSIAWPEYLILTNP